MNQNEKIFFSIFDNIYQLLLLSLPTIIPNNLILLFTVEPKPYYFNRNIYKMGGNQSIEKDLSEYKNNERIGLFRHVQIHGETFVEIVKNIPNEKVFTNWI